MTEELIKQSQTVGAAVNHCATTLLDDDSNDLTKVIESCLDAKGLLFELHRDTFLSPEKKHVAIGTYVHDMKLAIALSFTSKALGILKVVQGTAGDEPIVQIQGKMMRTDVGIFAVRVVTQDLKEVKIVGPPAIEFSRESQLFTVELQWDAIAYTPDKKPAHFLEFYVRNKPETIPYGQPSEDKINVKHNITLTHRIPLEHYPDPRQAYEDMRDEDRKAAIEERAREMEDEKRRKEEEEEAEREAIKEEQRRLLQDAEKERQMQRKLEEQEAKEEGASSKSIAQSSQRGALKSGKSSASQMPSSPGPRSQKSIPVSDQSKEMSPRSGEEFQEMSGDEINGASPQMREPREVTIEHEKQRLAEAIEDAKRAHEDLLTRNLRLQRQIVQMRQRSDVAVERQADMSTTENKYLNTLANLQEVHKKMLHVKEQYNSWTTKHEENLYEKQGRCEEIKEYFRDFKREVAKGAEFNKNGNPIPERMISKWERDEIEKDKEVQEFRITNIKLKNKLAKLEKEMRDKEKLADGLQLIDYEQLKIENQTLNEKIEERNEELHKLNKKIISTVHILTHIREKLHFVTAQKAKLNSDFEDLQRELETERKKLNELKKHKEDLRAENQKRRQETGIANSKLLTEDLELRTQMMQEMQDRIKGSERKLTDMAETVKRATVQKSQERK